MHKDLQTVIYPTDAHQVRQWRDELFGMFVDRAKDSLGQGCLVALEETVPSGIAGWLLYKRRLCRRNQGEEFLLDYWADILLFPMQEQRIAVIKDNIKCLRIPLLTLERRVLGCLGKKRLTAHLDDYEHMDELAREMRQWKEQWEQDLTWCKVPEWIAEEFTQWALVPCGSAGSRNQDGLGEEGRDGNAAIPNIL